ncbi:hypothetical protein [Poseidonibacter ostreae]|uniref:Uncharacterized protein n=1 Tax=Poseidonibacter ostreae TaxID=2654171 RepID=A0A6L4WTV8_9BACT|nr:hypothetical protein [Poseidonibacter ostreae]KAB7889558.1 hypothetical protein GBG19_05745 [Poseidonibacter ostreae]
MKKLQKEKGSYRVVFINEQDEIDVERTERLDVLMNKAKLGILECKELERLGSTLGGNFTMDDLRNDVLDLVDYHEAQIKSVNGIGADYD